MTYWPLILTGTVIGTVTAIVLLKCLVAIVVAAREERSRELATGSWRDRDRIEYGGSDDLVCGPATIKTPADCDLASDADTVEMDVVPMTRLTGLDQLYFGRMPDRPREIND